MGIFIKPALPRCFLTMETYMRRRKDSIDYLRRNKKMREDNYAAHRAKVERYGTKLWEALHAALSPSPQIVHAVNLLRLQALCPKQVFTPKDVHILSMNTGLMQAYTAFTAEELQREYVSAHDELSQVIRNLSDNVRQLRRLSRAARSNGYVGEEQLQPFQDLLLRPSFKAS